ncbi:MAG: cysteine--tRNA ligase [Dethiobacteria bacterium]|nr:cysteine--tRNA ligase [Bacillota bacterium]NMD32703.1 cysteine--tRNA ligase [Bacillota bacterium]
MTLKLYNTLTRCKEEFKPLAPPLVTFYVCGPTVYDYIHIGNARVFIVFDVVRRYLNYRGYRVKMVQNYTDIDDKMIQRAREEGLTVAELAHKYITAYEDDAARLRIRPADLQPRATEHIEPIVKLIQRLEEQGLAYHSGGDVYFNAGGFPGYGQLSHQAPDELLAGARVEPGEWKKNPLDFTLWKGRKEGEPAWESPWGKGRPGWHIECSSMAMHYLGETIDLHAGGADLIFPHHENEIAQSTGATGKLFTRYWLHAGYLNIEEKKMSKSLGNVLTVRRLLEEYNPLDLRFFILSAHYRSPLNFSRELIGQARAGRERLQEFVDNLYRALPGAGTETTGLEEKIRSELISAWRRFDEAMDDDFNTAAAIAVLFELAREGNIYLQKGHPYQRELLEQLLNYFREVNELFEILEIRKPVSLDEELRRMIARREEARRKKDWALADHIRNELQARGIILEDTPHGTRWKHKPGR